jgi:hypothetical protein
MLQRVACVITLGLKRLHKLHLSYWVHCKACLCREMLQARTYLHYEILACSIEQLLLRLQYLSLMCIKMERLDIALIRNKYAKTKNTQLMSSVRNRLTKKCQNLFVLVGKVSQLILDS